MRRGPLFFVIAAFATGCGLLNMYHASDFGAQHTSSFTASSESTNKFEKRMVRIEMSVGEIVQTLKTVQGQLPDKNPDNISTRIRDLEKTVAELQRLHPGCRCGLNTIKKSFLGG